MNHVKCVDSVLSDRLIVKKMHPWIRKLLRLMIQCLLVVATLLAMIKYLSHRSGNLGSYFIKDNREDISTSEEGRHYSAESRTENNWVAQKRYNLQMQAQIMLQQQLQEKSMRGNDHIHRSSPSIVLRDSLVHANQSSNLVQIQRDPKSNAKTGSDVLHIDADTGMKNQYSGLKRKMMQHDRESSDTLAWNASTLFRLNRSKDTRHLNDTMPVNKDMSKVKKWSKQYNFFLQSGALSSVIRNKCVDSGGGRYSGSVLRMATCGEKNKNQRFQMTGNKLIQVHNKGKLECVEATSHLAKFHACDDSKSAQSWEFQTVPSRHKQFGYLVNKKFSTCLTKPPVGRQTDSKAAVVMERCNNQCNQTWSFGQAVQRLQSKAFKPPRSHPKVLCWILTYPLAATTKARAVNNTWAGKCTYLLFMTTDHIDGLETVKLVLHGPEGRDKLWTKSKLAWLHVYQHYINKADWFVKADDDTYVSMDNLRRYLLRFDANKPWQLGRLFQKGKNTRYFSGGSGIVLSRGALKILGDAMTSFQDPKWAGQINGTGPEDLLTSLTLEGLGIGAQECVDDDGRQLFLPMGIDYEYFAPKRDESSWFYKYSKTVAAGPACCSRRWVAVHYVKIPEMFGLDQLEHHPCVMDTEEWPHLDLT